MSYPQAVFARSHWSGGTLYQYANPNGHRQPDTDYIFKVTNCDLERRAGSQPQIPAAGLHGARRDHGRHHIEQRACREYERACSARIHAPEDTACNQRAADKQAGCSGEISDSYGRRCKAAVSGIALNSVLTGDAADQRAVARY